MPGLRKVEKLVSNIWRQPVDGGRPVPVTQFQNDLIFSFDISPDGKSLVCERGTMVRRYSFKRIEKVTKNKN